MAVHESLQELQLSGAPRIAFVSSYLNKQQGRGRGLYSEPVIHCGSFLWWHVFNVPVASGTLKTCHHSN